MRELGDYGIRVSDCERFFIDFTYDRQVTGNLEKADRTLELWLQTYPRGGSATERAGLARGHLDSWDRPIRNGLIETARSANHGGFLTFHFWLLQSCGARPTTTWDCFDEAEGGASVEPPERKLDGAAELAGESLYNIAARGKGDREQMGRIMSVRPRESPERNSALAPPGGARAGSCRPAGGSPGDCRTAPMEVARQEG